MAPRHYLTIAVTAWMRTRERLNYFKKMSLSLANLDSTNVSIRRLVSLEAQGNDPLVLAEFQEYLKEDPWEIIYKNQKPNLASNMNYLISQIQTPYFIYLQDDWALQKPLEIIRDLDFMDKHPTLGALRYYVVPGSVQLSPLEETYQEINRSAVYFFTDNPSLRRMTLHTEMGPYTTKVHANGHDHSLGEMDMNDRVKASRWRVVQKDNGLVWDHVGTVSSLTEKWDDLSKGL